MIPLFDLRLEPEDIAAVEAVYASGRLEMGERVEAFERAFADQLGAKHGIAVSSCTAALHLAYLAAGVGPGDEVIVPTMTFAATANAALYCGATPVFADVVSERDFGVDPDGVEALITERTKAVCAVHYAGYPADLPALRELCDRRGLALIEDAAHAPSAELDGRKLGTWGLAGCFSFFSNKILSVGEGGLVATDDDEVAAFCRAMRSHGLGADGDVVRPGFNYRMDDAHGALLGSRLARMEADIARRRELSLQYRALLSGVAGVSAPYEDDEVALSSCYVMPLVLDDPEKQGPLRAQLRENGVQTSLLYPCVHEFTAFRERYGEISLPRAERIARTQVTVPLFPHMTEEQLGTVVKALEEALDV